MILAADIIAARRTKARARSPAQREMSAGVDEKTHDGQEEKVKIKRLVTIAPQGPSHHPSDDAWLQCCILTTSFFISKLSSTITTSRTSSRHCALFNATMAGGGKKLTGRVWFRALLCTCVLVAIVGTAFTFGGG